jgi:hypothetical protein
VRHVINKEYKAKRFYVEFTGKGETEIIEIINNLKKKFV